MGPELALMLPSAQTVAVSAYIDFLPDVQYSKPLGSSRFLKAIRCLDKQGTVVVKLLIKPNTELDLEPALRALEKLRRSLIGVPNVLAYQSIMDSQRACYLIRPYLRYNLYDRLSIRPFLEAIEKKWIVYQLLVAISRSHAKSIYHGDLKTENILLTSWNWVLVSDFATLKPVYLPEDNPSQFSFYFDTSKRHSCYLAPERFVSKDEEQVSEMNNSSKLTPQMDIFALGCVIAEVYTEGLPIFTLPQIFKYKKDEYSPSLDAIRDSNVLRLVRGMIKLDPADRLSAQQCLDKFRGTVFPDSFYTFLHPYICKLSESKGRFQLCDQRINQIYNDFNKIALYLGFKRSLTETNDSDAPNTLSMPGMRRHELKSTSQVFKKGSVPDCTSLIPLSLVLHTLRNTTHASFRIKACDLILAFAEQLHDEAKLDRCLPYLVYMLDDPSEDVQGAALRTLTQLLSMVESITPINIYLFPEYLIPKLQTFLKRCHDSPDHTYIRVVFATCLPHIALAAKRFYEIADVVTSDFGLLNDPDTEDGSAANNSDVNYKVLLDGFESMTIQIMTDPDAHVRIGLLNHIQPLCTFFGRERTNDVILSHLITYLNDKDVQLKLAFSSSIVTIAIFVGIVSLEQYILPLLVQALTTPCELVVIDLLKVFCALVRLGLIRKQYLWDLVKITIKLILHPNEMIREAVLNLTIAIGDTLSVADFYCILYPIIRPYFEREVTKFTWDDLFICTCSPITTAAYNIAKNWSLSHEPTLFWQRVSDNSKTDSFGNKPMSFMRKRTGPDNVIENIEIPLSMEDAKQVERLKDIGFPESELWKIATLRSYIYSVAHLGAATDKQDADINYNRVNILPRSVFVDVAYKPEAIPQSPKRKRTSITSVSYNPANSVLLLGDARASAPSVGEAIDNAYGDTATLVSSLKGPSLSLGGGESVFSGTSGFSVLNETLAPQHMTTVVKHSYTGSNPYIIKFLKSLKYEPSIDDYAEFGPAVMAADSSDSPPGNALVSRFVEHKSAVNCVATSPDSSIFVTGDEQGYLKLWDTARLENNVTGKSICSLNLSSAVKSLDFISDRNCFAVSTKDGLVRIFRFELIPRTATHRKTISVTLIRQHRVSNGEYALKLRFSISKDRPYLAYVTVSSRIIVINVCAMTVAITLQNNVLHGRPTAIELGPLGSWLLVGTSKGVLDLWDLSFQLNVKCAKLKSGNFPIHAIQRLPDKFDVAGSKGKLAAVIGGTGESDVIVWDLSVLQPRIVLSSSSVNSTIDSYTVLDLSMDGTDSVIEQLAGLRLTRDSVEVNNVCTAIAVSWPVLCSASHSGKVIQWDLAHPKQSKVIVAGYGEKCTTSPAFSETQINNLTIINEIYTSETLKKSSWPVTTRTRDTITGLAVIDSPYRMILTAGRSGTVNVYK